MDGDKNGPDDATGIWAVKYAFLKFCTSLFIIIVKTRGRAHWHMHVVRVRHTSNHVNNLKLVQQNLCTMTGSIYNIPVVHCHDLTVLITVKFSVIIYLLNTKKLDLYMPCGAMAHTAATYKYHVTKVRLVLLLCKATATSHKYVILLSQ
jgi:hypothetical protein